MPREGTARIKCTITARDTTKAMLVITDDDEEHWLPFSQVHEICREEGYVVVSQWFADKEGLV